MSSEVILLIFNSVCEAIIRNKMFIKCKKIDILEFRAFYITDISYYIIVNISFYQNN